MTLPIAAKYVHTNLVAHDWRALADFYVRVFGCTLLAPERDLSGEALARGTAVPGAALRGAHLRLPGCGPDGPTLEIFTYATHAERPPTAANRPGFGHIAFVVPDVAAALAEALAAGGSPHGEVVTTAAGRRRVTWAYLRDPEGNLVELQAWVE